MTTTHSIPHAMVSITLAVTSFAPAVAAADDCQDVRRVRRLAVAAGLDDGTLATLESRHCAPPPVAAPSEGPCERQTIMAALAAADRRVLGDDAVTWVVGARSAACRGVRAPSAGSWPNGAPAVRGDELRYPNGVVARRADGSWYYPSGVAAYRGGRYFYATGAVARREDGEWRDLRGGRASPGAVAAVACAARPEAAFCREEAPREHARDDHVATIELVAFASATPPRTAQLVAPPPAARTGP